MKRDGVAGSTTDKREVVGDVFETADKPLALQEKSETAIADEFVDVDDEVPDKTNSWVYMRRVCVKAKQESEERDRERDRLNKTLTDVGGQFNQLKGC